MRSLVLVTIAVSWCLAAASAAAKPYPYLVHVAQQDAPLRSGPGDEYYETSRLPAGTAVEVWREVPGGWLAVRPPRGSYSLVAAAHVRVRPDRVAEVVSSDVPAHVGSKVAADRDVVQVLLSAGERVQVLETVTLDGEFWHQIAPPSGEFRWIHNTQVAGPSGKPPAESTLAAETPIGGTDTPSPTRDGQAFRVARHSAAAQTAEPVSAPLMTGEAPQTLAEAAGHPIGPRPGDRSVTPAEIELELATIVAEDSRLWQFENLKRLCEELLTSSGPAARREDLDSVLDKIARFERIRDGKLAVLGMQPPASSPEDQPHPPRHDSAARTPITWQAARAGEEQGPMNSISSVGDVVRIPDQPVFTAEEPGRYDGIGTLRAVVSRRREAPRYALVDPQGDVVSFITPSPGVNLQPYVGQRVGVVGTRGYMPEFRRTHVTAARVTPLR